MMFSRKAFNYHKQTNNYELRVMITFMNKNDCAKTLTTSTECVTKSLKGQFMHTQH